MKKKKESTIEQNEIQFSELSWMVRTSARPIVNNVSGRIKQGEFHVLLGPNGAGKTSLLKLLLAFNKKSRGTINISGKPLEDYSRKELARKLAYLPQISQSYYDLPVREVIAMARYSLLKPFAKLRKEDYDAIDEAIYLSGSTSLAEKNFSHLSGGERQRVLSARAIAQESAFILLDEPVSNLDLKYQHQILATLQNLCRERATGIVCVLHDINLARQYADKAFLMKEGKILAEGPVEETLQASLLTEVYEWPIEEIRGEKSQGSFFISRAGAGSI